MLSFPVAGGFVSLTFRITQGETMRTMRSAGLTLFSNVFLWEIFLTRRSRHFQLPAKSFISG